MENELLTDLKRAERGQVCIGYVCIVALTMITAALIAGFLAWVAKP